MTMIARRPPRQLTVGKFFEWCPDDGRKWQLFDGEPRAMAPSRRRHGAVQAELAALIRNRLLEAGSPCVVITEPGVVPRINAARNFRIPDLAVTCSAEAGDDDAVDEPVLIVEIPSVGHARETIANVWAYTSIPSVREILVLRTSRIAAEILRRRADRSWPENAEPVGANLVLESIGMTVALAAAYRMTGVQP